MQIASDLRRCPNARLTRAFDRDFVAKRPGIGQSFKSAQRLRSAQPLEFTQFFKSSSISTKPGYSIYRNARESSCQGSPGSKCQACPRFKISGMSPARTPPPPPPATDTPPPGTNQKPGAGGAVLLPAGYSPLPVIPTPGRKPEAGLLVLPLPVLQNRQRNCEAN